MHAYLSGGRPFAREWLLLQRLTKPQRARSFTLTPPELNVVGRNG